MALWKMKLILPVCANQPEVNNYLHKPKPAPLYGFLPCFGKLPCLCWLSIGAVGWIPALVAQETVKYNMQLGPVGLNVLPSMTMEVNDNIFFDEINRSTDLILHPQINLDAMWQVSRLNILTLSSSIGIQRFIKHTELNSDSLLVSPETASSVQTMENGRPQRAASTAASVTP